MSAENKQFTKEELKQIDEADDLKISPFRDDGVTYGTPTWIWAVVASGDLYVRAYNGQDSRWYRAAIKQKAGRIHAAGMTKEVIFEPVEGDINAQIDEAYKKKYAAALICRRWLAVAPHPQRSGLFRKTFERQLMVVFVLKVISSNKLFSQTVAKFGDVTKRRNAE
jgi:hypothetical protein